MQSIISPFNRKAIKESFGRAASAYDAEAHLQRWVRGRCIALAKQCWPKDAHILDAGSGTGVLAQEADWRIAGLDISFGMCEFARGKHDRVVNADAAAMPFADGAFDGVFSSLMLQWAGDPAAVWREMARVLKAQGRVVLSTLAAGTLHELRQAFSILDAAPHVSHFLEAHEVLEGAATAGFSMVAAEQARVVEYYPDAVALMRALQSIGASHKQAGRRKGLMTLRQLASVERAYAKQFGNAQGLPATWQVLYLVVQKK